MALKIYPSFFMNITDAICRGRFEVLGYNDGSRINSETYNIYNFVY